MASKFEAAEKQKVFCFFSSEKKIFLPISATTSKQPANPAPLPAAAA
jgi:hypothetical protein